MQTTLRIDDMIYRQAKVAAASEGITLTKFIEEALRARLAQASSQGDSQQPAEVDMRQALEDNTAGSNRAALLERLQNLFERADERDRLQEGSTGPFAREELYAERLDGFR